MNRILLRKGRERSVLKGHPWVFSGAVESGDASAGELVEVCDSKGEKHVLLHSKNSSVDVRHTLIDYIESHDTLDYHIN